MTVLLTIHAVLCDQFKAFRNNPAIDFELARKLVGAATLAHSVADHHRDVSLQNLATNVMNWVNEWEENLELTDQHERNEAYRASVIRKDLEKQTFRLVKAFVGQEHPNFVWKRLVDLYQTEFPSFIVRESVYARISPKKQAARLRTILLSRLLTLKLGSTPSPTEIEENLPAALIDLTEQTLSYLEKVLPGFDFRSRLVQL